MTSSEALMPRSAEAITNRQRLFVRYFTAILIDLVVLNLFVEYSDKVFVDSFTTSLLAAVLLQVLLKLTPHSSRHAAAAGIRSFDGSAPGWCCSVPSSSFSRRSPRCSETTSGLAASGTGS